MPTNDNWSWQVLTESDLTEPDSIRDLYRAYVYSMEQYIVQFNRSDNLMLLDGALRQYKVSAPVPKENIKIIEFFIKKDTDSRFYKIHGKDQDGQFYMAGLRWRYQDAKRNLKQYQSEIYYFNNDGKYFTRSRT